MKGTNENYFSYFHRNRIISKITFNDSSAESNNDFMNEIESPSPSELESSDDLLSKVLTENEDEDKLICNVYENSKDDDAESISAFQIANDSVSENNESVLFSRNVNSSNACSNKGEILRGDEEIVNETCFCGTYHYRNSFCIQCSKCGIWWNTTRTCIRIKKGADIADFD